MSDQTTVDIPAVMELGATLHEHLLHIKALDEDMDDSRLHYLDIFGEGETKQSKLAQAHHIREQDEAFFLHCSAIADATVDHALTMHSLDQASA